MFQERLARLFLLAPSTGKLPRGCPRTRLRDYIAHLVCSGLGVEPTGLSEIAESPKVFSTRNSPQRKWRV